MTASAIAQIIMVATLLLMITGNLSTSPPFAAPPFLPWWQVFPLPGKKA